jgi:hypothetical protein
MRHLETVSDKELNPQSWYSASRIFFSKKIKKKRYPHTIIYTSCIYINVTSKNIVKLKKDVYLKFKQIKNNVYFIAIKLNFYCIY